MKTSKKIASKKTAPVTQSLTVAAYMKALIAAGFSNEEVFDAARKEFGIGEEKKSYPAWYRGALRRDGVKV